MTFNTELAHLVDGAAGTLHARLSLLFADWLIRDRNGGAVHPAMLSAAMDTDELTEAIAVLARALADATEREHAERQQARYAELEKAEQERAALKARLSKFAVKPTAASKRPASEMAVTA